MQNMEIGVSGMPPPTWVDWWQPCGLPPHAWLHGDPFFEDSLFRVVEMVHGVVAL